MKKHSTRSFFAGVILTVLIFGLASPAGAALISKTIEVSTGASIYIDGVEMKPTDANGNPVDTFIYNGTTYVPLRAVSQSLGYNVNWDGANQRVYIGEMPGQKQYLLDVCPPYQTFGCETPDVIQMAGQKYTNGMTWRLAAFNVPTSYALFNLNGQYNTLEFDLGHVDGSHMYGASLSIYLDGKLAISEELDPYKMPEHLSIPLNGALQMKIEMTVKVAGNTYGFGNIEIY